MRQIKACEIHVLPETSEEEKVLWFLSKEGSDQGVECTDSFHVWKEVAPPLLAQLFSVSAAATLGLAGGVLFLCGLRHFLLLSRPSADEVLQSNFALVLRGTAVHAPASAFSHKNLFCFHIMVGSSLLDCI